MAKTVFISSTTLGLKAHREAVVDACERRKLRPVAMEHWAAEDARPMDVVLREVEAADIFVGFYGRRYGSIPSGETRSVIELEYRRARERGKPLLLFVMAESHTATGEGDTPDGHMKAFLADIGAERTWKTFKSAENLALEVYQALEPYAGGSLKVDLTHLPVGAPHFLGREPELAALDAAWANQGHTAIVELIAPGGTGKTALVTRWAEHLKLDDWRGAEQVFGWSFYSQGTSDDRQASEDHFLAEAVKWFGIPIPDNAHAADKGRALAQELVKKRTLLVLDGVEPLQYPPGPLAGELRAPGVQALLRHLTTAGQRGLCVLTSREWLKDLDTWVRSDHHPAGPVLRVDLGNLSEDDGARLLHAAGVKKAGQAAIQADDTELKEASREVLGHALTLTLLARYLAKAHKGDIRQWRQVDFAQATKRTGGHAFRVISALERWLAGSPGSAVELAVLRLLGYFDRPATAGNLAALRAAPAIPGLSEALQGITQADWNMAVSNLADCRLVLPEELSVADLPVTPAHNDRWGSTPLPQPLSLKGRGERCESAAPTITGTDSLDAHPLVREYFAAELAQKQPVAWREGHRRIYEQLKKDTPQRPDTLTGLQPLYQAVAHGCKAGLAQEACVEVYRDRILRGTGSGGNYSTFKLGAIGADLGAIACFFIEPWRQLAPELGEGDQAWLLNEAAFSLRALGRLAEALEPMRAGAEMGADAEDWSEAAIRYSNLSELELSLGRIKEAVADGERSVAYADRSGAAFERMGFRTTLADARHQAGEIEAARQGFVEAEGLQAERQPEYPLLYSLRGFRYCDLLLAGAERAVWVGIVSDQPLRDGSSALVGINSDLQAVAKRAAQTLLIAKRNNWLLDIALDHLTLARCALYADLLQGRRPGAEAQSQTEAAVSGLRAAGSQHHIPRGLLTRALLRHALGDVRGAESDLREAEDIAARGGMKLHLADLALTRARLFRAPSPLATARTLIQQCGYNRRLPELEDAEAALGVPR